MEEVVETEENCLELDSDLEDYEEIPSLVPRGGSSISFDNNYVRKIEKVRENKHSSSSSSCPMDVRLDFSNLPASLLHLETTLVNDEPNDNMMISHSDKSSRLKVPELLEEEEPKIQRGSMESDGYLLDYSLKSEEKIKVDLRELPLDEAFCSSTVPEKKSVMHLQAINRQREMLGESTPTELRDYIPPPQEAPEEEYAIPSPPRSFLSLIRSIIAFEPPRPSSPPFRYETNVDALVHNDELLASFDYDIDLLIDEYKDNTISPGSEFRDPLLLAPLISSHPSWSNFYDMMTKGVSCDFHPISEEQRIEDIKTSLSRGNHKSATTNQTLLEDLLQDDISAGFQVPLPVSSLRKIKNGVIAPYGIAFQSSINERGEVIPKERVTHDQSFCFSENNSVNDRLIRDDLPELRYGPALCQIIHYVHALRFAFPSAIIVASKIDLKAAYRRAHLSGALAAMALTVVGCYALLSLRLPFGGAYCPFWWCVVSELICDLANALLRCKFWDPDSFSFANKEKIPPPRLSDSNDPWQPALPADVLVDPDPRGRSFCYIDDLITIGIFDSCWKRLAYAVALATDVFARPLHPDEPVPRDDLLSIKKLKAEGALEEHKTILGWFMDFRQLKIHLSKEKFSEWSSDIRKMIKNKSATMKAIDTMVGRNGHASFVIPLSRHFNNRLRRKIDRRRNINTKLRFSKRELEDLKLWLLFYKRAFEGISFNIIVFRRPTKIYVSDSCPYGMGGFSIRHGRAWRFKLPIELVGLVSNNLLEFIAEIVCIWLDVVEGRMEKYDCCLSFGDNTSAVSWLHKSNFCDASQIPHEAAARHLASLCIRESICLYSQHFKGKRNVITDSLSRDFHVPRHVLTALFHHLCPEQIPKNFEILDLPPKIESWICKTLRLSSKQPLDPKEQMTSTAGAGLVGCRFCAPSSLTETISWIQYQSGFDLPSLSCSLKPSGMENLAEETKQIWLRSRSGRPWTKWQRSSWPMEGSTHSSLEIP